MGLGRCISFQIWLFWISMVDSFSFSLQRIKIPKNSKRSVSGRFTLICFLSSHLEHHPSHNFGDSLNVRACGTKQPILSPRWFKPILKNSSQIGYLPQFSGWWLRIIWNHHLVSFGQGVGAAAIQISLTSPPFHPPRPRLGSQNTKTGQFRSARQNAAW